MNHSEGPACLTTKSDSSAGEAPTAAVPRSQAMRPGMPRRRRSERAEGVISTAISVLIIAFLGIALWTGFNSMMNSATDKTRVQVEQIGN